MVITWVYFFYIQLSELIFTTQGVKEIKWITSYNTTIINSMSNETTDVTRKPDNMTKMECGCSWTVCTQWRDMNRAMTSKTA
jgi:hypothetical protein